MPEGGIWWDLLNQLRHGSRSGSRAVVLWAGARSAAAGLGWERLEKRCLVLQKCPLGLQLCSAPSLALLLTGVCGHGPACCKERTEGLVCGLALCPAVPARPGTAMLRLWMGYRACGQREGLTMLLLSVCDTSPA